MVLPSSGRRTNALPTLSVMYVAPSAGHYSVVSCRYAALPEAGFVGSSGCRLTGGGLLLIGNPPDLGPHVACGIVHVTLVPAYRAALVCGLRGLATATRSSSSYPRAGALPARRARGRRTAGPHRVGDSRSAVDRRPQWDRPRQGWRRDGRTWCGVAGMEAPR
jgi:hypothetical protein